MAVPSFLFTIFCFFLSVVETWFNTKKLHLNLRLLAWDFFHCLKLHLIIFQMSTKRRFIFVLSLLLSWPIVLRRTVIVAVTCAHLPVLTFSNDWLLQPLKPFFLSFLLVMMMMLLTYFQTLEHKIIEKYVYASFWEDILRRGNSW